MGKLERLTTIFSAEAETYANEVYEDGKLKYVVHRDIGITLNSEYGEYATATLSLDEAKQVVAMLEEEIAKASKSDEEIIENEKKRMEKFQDIIDGLTSRENQEA